MPDARFVCMPCFTMVPNRTGTLTVHGADPDIIETLTVWCPWCGDEMEPAEDLLTEDELAEGFDGD